MAALSGAALLLSGIASPAHAQTVVMTGLFNPRGLTVASDGSIYVAEAGSGGGGTTVTGAAGETVGYGNTGGVSRLQNGVQERLISNLPSLALSDGTQASGLNDIIQASNGTFYGVTGFVGDPALRNNFTQSGENGQGFGRLVSLDFTGGGTATFLADLSANETTNPDGTDVNSNPFSLVQTANGFTVADAGANLLLDVAGTTTVSTHVIFPTKPNPLPFGPPVYQPVPTSVTLGRDAMGNDTLFVGQLTGFPFPKGAAEVFSVSPTTLNTYTTAFTGFTNIIDVAYDNGQLFVVELTTNGLAGQPPGGGNLWQVDVAKNQRTLLLSGLDTPGGVAVRGGQVYVTTGNTSAGGGGVIQVAAAPEPGSIAFVLLGSAAFIPCRRRRA